MTRPPWLEEGRQRKPGAFEAWSQMFVWLMVGVVLGLVLVLIAKALGLVVGGWLV